MSGAASRLTRPARVLRARTRWLRDLARHRAEVRAGRSLAARADRTPIFILGSPRSGGVTNPLATSSSGHTSASAMRLPHESSPVPVGSV